MKRSRSSYEAQSSHLSEHHLQYPVITAVQQHLTANGQPSVFSECFDDALDSTEYLHPLQNYLGSDNQADDAQALRSHNKAHLNKAHLNTAKVFDVASQATLNLPDPSVRVTKQVLLCHIIHIVGLTPPQAKDLPSHQCRTHQPPRQKQLKLAEHHTVRTVACSLIQILQEPIVT